MPENRPLREIVLLGIGHTNAHVVRMWKTRPIPGARLTCVSNFPTATYSGMLPGVLAGQYSPQQMQIDLPQLCAAADARLIVGNVRQLDRSNRRLLFDDRPEVPYDVLSIGIGSRPTHAGVELDGESWLPIKPMQTFVERLRERLVSIAPQIGGRPLRLIVVGGGAGGVELMFCVPHQVRLTLGDVPLDRTLIHGGSEVPEGMLPRARRLVDRQFRSRQIQVILDRRVTRVEPHQVTLDDDRVLPADLVLWATGAAAPPLLAELGLPTDSRGFLLTDSTLRCVDGDPIFAVGDTGSIDGMDVPKAGVYAVRQAPVLWENIQRLMGGKPLQPYEPQSGFLALLNTGDGRAIGQWCGLAVRGRWCWLLKDAIDRRFVEQYK